jgi:hypothetical protein
MTAIFRALNEPSCSSVDDTSCTKTRVLNQPSCSGVTGTKPKMLNRPSCSAVSNVQPAMSSDVVDKNFQLASPTHHPSFSLIVKPLLSYHHDININIYSKI